jgi:esterase/lipase superfamily enzyme
VSGSPVSPAALSRRALLRALASSSAAIGLAGCAGLAATGTSFDASRISTRPVLLVATTRRAVRGARAAPWFGPERGSATLAAQAILTPPDTGRFSLAAVGLSEWRLDKVEMLPGQINDLSAEASQGRDILIFVHGYNHTFESAALDAARLSDGVMFQGDTLLFSWPSRAELLDYAYDRESAMWSRDALERVLDRLILTQGAGRVHIVAHSLGSMLVLESLRQLYARQSETAAARFGSVIFAAPDIDMDVFASSLARLGTLANRMTVIIAQNDLALAVSRKIAGGVARAGGADRAALERLGVNVVDASQEGWGLINHDLFLSNAAVRQVIRRAIDGSTAPA